MEEERNIITEPNYPNNENFHSKSVKKTKDKLNLPLISNNSNFDKNITYRKIDLSFKKSPKKVVNKRRMATAKSSNNKRYKINRDIDMVHKLNMETEVDQIFIADLKLKRKKEKIDNNPEVRAKRLNLLKISEENEKKIDIDSLEKEKYIERDFKDELEKLEKIKNECNLINAQINQILEVIDEYKLEINIYNNYGEILDKKYLKEMKEKEKEKKLEEIYANKEILEQVDEDLENNEEKNNNENKGVDLTKKNSKMEKFEQINAYAQRKKQREDKIKILRENITNKEEQIKELEEKQNNLIAQCKEKKNGIYKLRQQLLNIYHINLYEGLNFRSEGLCSLIRAIWNLGVNVDINYMPSYLDNDCINYLFDRAKRLIEITKIRQIVEENEKEFEQIVKQWRQSTNANENNKDSENKTNSNSNFFQTGVIENFDYMDKYPKSKEFMDEYNRKHFPKKNIEINLKQKNEFKSLNLPYVIIEKHNKIEKLKYLLKNLIEQNETKEKKEMERLSKEFLCNNYEEKYQVSIETIMGALCGEDKKDIGINFFNKYQREYNEGKKLIEFHKNINRFNKK